MKTQNQEVLSYLKKGYRLSTATAFTRMRITRLSARIYDLRQKGYPIAGKSVRGRSKRTGRLTRHHLYYLEGSDD